jgi:dihydroorotate dehydrogenase
MYLLLRKIFFLFPPEAVHHFSMYVMQLLCKVKWIRKLIQRQFCYQNVAPPITIAGIPFKNCVGLGAGFDKNARYLAVLEALGFGFVEIGTVTPLPQAGNDKPRLFRLPADKALINRMGFNNEGVKAVAVRLKEWREKVRSHESGVRSSEPENKKLNEISGSRLTSHDSRLIIGGNIGKNKITPNEEAWKDYEICFKELHPYVDYFVVNVSSPNTPGLRALQEKDSLKKILGHLQVLNAGYPFPKPIFLKIAPDLNEEQLKDVADLAMEIKLDGLVATNTTISREGLQTPAARLEAIGAGGLSGWPLRQRSTAVVRELAQKTNGQIPIIASGGIFAGPDAKEKLEAGASLVQVWTGFIYEGPGIVKKIIKQL